MNTLKNISINYLIENLPSEVLDELISNTIRNRKSEDKIIVYILKCIKKNDLDDTEEFLSFLSEYIDEFDVEIFNTQTYLDEMKYYFNRHRSLYNDDTNDDASIHKNNEINKLNILINEYKIMNDNNLFNTILDIYNNFLMPIMFNNGIYDFIIEYPNYRKYFKIIEVYKYQYLSIITSMNETELYRNYDISDNMQHNRYDICRFDDSIETSENCWTTYDIYHII